MVAHMRKKKEKAVYNSERVKHKCN